MADGFESGKGSKDDGGFRFWPLAEIEPVTTYAEGKSAFHGSESYFVFADYLDESWEYAIQLHCRAHCDNRVVMIGTATGEPYLVARSFAEFVALYISDDLQIYPGGDLISNNVGSQAKYAWSDDFVAVRAELERLCATCSDDESLGRLLRGLGCYYCASAEVETYGAFVEEVDRALKI